MKTIELTHGAQAHTLESLFPTLVQLYDSLVFWTWVKCGVAFALGFALGRFA